MKTYHGLLRLTVLVSFLIVSSSNLSFTQQTGISEFQYISPMPGSAMNSPNTNIIIRYGKVYNEEDIYSEKFLEVKGEKSGLHSGRIILAENNRTFLFEPDVPFNEGESVNIKFLKAVKTEDDDFVPMLSFHFKITEHNLTDMIKKNPTKFLREEISEFKNLNPTNSIKPENDNFRYSVMDDSLPEDFPEIRMDSINNPTPGLIFMAPFNGWASPYKNYLIIVDNYGVPVFYRQFMTQLFDFKKQNNGILTYYNALFSKFFALDSSYSVVDSFSTKNGYVADLHDLVITNDNHLLLLSSDWQHVAMDTVVPGGNPNATVIGLVVQEQDENRNVIFQWRSWDHFKITDATYDISLTDSIIDYVHVNAIELDNDGNLLVSCRHMDEVTKINRQTGDIIWRWGGEHCENNQFTFVNDPIGFSHQHDIRRLDNGNLTLFDNGNLHSPTSTRVAEYQLDEINKLAFLVWEYKNNPVSYSYAMGDARRLPNHNTFIGWGAGTSPAISEIKPDGKVALYLTLPDTVLNYRGIKSQWKTNLFSGNPESLVFGYVPYGDSIEMSLDIINNSDQQIEINGVYNRDSVYSIIETLPITLLPFGTATVTVKFKPEIPGIADYFDDLHLRWDTEGQRIAQIVPLIGSTDPNFTSVEPENVVSDYHLSQNYPNPFNPATSIQYAVGSLQFISLKIYDVLGNEVATLVNEEKPAGTYEVRYSAVGLSSGIYFYRLQAGSFVETKKMILLR